MTSWDNLASANAHRVTLTGYPVPFPGQNRAVPADAGAWVLPGMRAARSGRQYHR